MRGGKCLTTHRTLVIVCVVLCSCTVLERLSVDTNACLCWDVSACNTYICVYVGEAKGVGEGGGIEEIERR